MITNFDNYYYEIYHQRWEVLKKCLLENRTLHEYKHNLTQSYFLDYSSVLAALSLKLNTNESSIILDACAAPGGKSLVLASSMPVKSTLIANEFSNERRRKLLNVLNEYLPEEIRSKVKVSGFDAAAIGRKKNEHNRFDAILLDAPCSSEAHVLKNEKAFSEWTAARPKYLAQRQWSLLSSAFLLLKQDGCLVYSTCAISEIENDGVIERLIKKYTSSLELYFPDFQIGEKTKYGKIILPDECGFGPMYVARIVKK